MSNGVGNSSADLGGSYSLVSKGEGTETFSADLGGSSNLAPRCCEMW